MSKEFPTDFATYRQMSKEFFDLCKTATHEEAENGFKMLSLVYLGLEGLSDRETIESQIILDIAAREVGKLDPLAIRAAEAMAFLKSFVGMNRAAV